VWARLPSVTLRTEEVHERAQRWCLIAGNAKGWYSGVSGSGAQGGLVLSGHGSDAVAEAHSGAPAYWSGRQCMESVAKEGST
jgi:hypothetical protein